MTSKLVMKLRRDSYLAAPAPDVESLTPRERQILAWLARGVSNKEIARALDLAESTAVWFCAPPCGLPTIEGVRGFLCPLRLRYEG